MIHTDRDKVRIHALLKTRRGEAFTADELAKVTGIPVARITAAGDALVAAGMVRREENYFWAQSAREVSADR